MIMVKGRGVEELAWHGMVNLKGLLEFAVNIP
jgi:hypothetical protein